VIVIDASAAVAHLTGSDGYEALAKAMSAEGHIVSTTLIDYQVGSALRRLCMAKKLDEAVASSALQLLAAYPVRREDARALAPRMWELRRNISYYDAGYVALAEMLGAPLFTLDAKLASSPGHSAKIVCF
jgi:predicted nucleic acid-binding protein